MSDKKRKHRYKHVEGKRWIEVRVRSPQQLFDARDPAPFRERDLDDDFVEYIFSAAREFTIATPLKLVIHIEDKESKDLNKDSVRDSIREYFSYRIDLQTNELKNFIKRAQVYLAIGLVILFVCLSFAQKLGPPLSPGSIGILREGIVIFGWVSLWKPIELILFDWYPLYEKLRYYKKLLKTEIEIRFST